MCERINNSVYLIGWIDAFSVSPITRRPVPANTRWQFELYALLTRQIDGVLVMYPAQFLGNLVEFGHYSVTLRQAYGQLDAEGFCEATVLPAEQEVLFVHLTAVPMHSAHHLDMFEYRRERLGLLGPESGRGNV